MANNDQRKSELIAELDRARSRASAHRREMHGAKGRASAKATSTVARHRYGWMLGALIGGFIITKLPTRTKKVVVDRRGKRVSETGLETAGKTGLFLAILKIGIDLAKPILMAWITKRLGEAVHVGKQVKQKVEKVDRKT